jgi:hypothetical protein
MSGKKLMSFRFPEPLADRLKEVASEEGVSITELVARYSRMGLNLASEDRFSSLETMLENGMLLEPYPSTHAIVPAVLSDDDTTERAVNGNPASISQNTDSTQGPHLINEFETFIHLLEDSTEMLNTDIREEILTMIGQLSILKARLKAEPSLKRGMAQS